jgi:hypothetical protein
MRPIVSWLVVSAIALACATQLSAQTAPSDRAALMTYCDHIDSVSAPTMVGARERTDCWKRLQLEGLDNALVAERYRAAVRDYDAAAAADSARRALATREAQIDQQLRQLQQAMQQRAYTTADSLAQVVLAVQPQNQRALAFHERVVAITRANTLRRTVYGAAGFVLLLGLGLGITARVLAVRQRKADEVARAVAAQRTATLRIIDGVGRGKMYTIAGPIFRIGSAQSDRPEEHNDMVLSDEAAYVSRYHCAILRRDGRYFLIDSSLNGTYIDDERLERGEPYPLDDGAEVTLSGVTRLKFLLV